MDFGFRFKQQQQQQDTNLYNWENVEPELIAKRAEEQKKVEESDHELTNNLFSNHSSMINDPVKPPKIPKKQNLKIDVRMINQTYQKKNIANSKTTKAKEKDIFGETMLDDIDQLACKIEDSYLYSLD